MFSNTYLPTAATTATLLAAGLSGYADLNAAHFTFGDDAYEIAGSTNTSTSVTWADEQQIQDLHVMHDFAADLLDQQEDMPSDISKAIERRFWDLF